MSALMEEFEPPRSGLSCCGHVHWGTHFCHVYESADELVDVLVPFFCEGLANNEQCLWVTSQPLPADRAQIALAARVPDFQERFQRGQIQIIDHEAWYASRGQLDEDATLEAWVDAEQSALAAGWSGLRLTGNITFLKSDADWDAFEHYESRVGGTFAGRRIIGLCTYQASKTSAAKLLDVVRNHQFTVAERNGQLQIVEGGVLAAARRGAQPANEGGLHEASRTASLEEALSLLEAQKKALERALRQRDEGRRQLEQELEDAQLLQELSATLIEEEVVKRVYDRIVDAAARLLQSDFATMQRLDRAGGRLELIASRGLTDEEVALWAWVRQDENTSCGLALRGRERSIVHNYADDPRVDAPTRAAFATAGIVAAQSTPLVSRSGELLGMISTHWSRPHHASARQLRLLDVVARQAADLLERSAAIQALHERTCQLVDADRRKDKFLATLAHELRNPLAPLRNGVGLMLSGDEGVRARVLPMMSRQLGHMVRLVDDLLDISRVSRGTITLVREPVRLDQIIQVAAETSRPLIDAARHTFTITQPGQQLWIDADLTRMAQVVSNVLNNAAKYTPDRGRISLSIVRDDADVQILISDNGVGIPEDMLDTVFDLFAQVESSRLRSHGGLGLGLSLARHLVSMHGGTIEARSGGANHGTTFCIRLPLVQAPTADVAVELAAGNAQSPRRVLVVDDNVDAAESLGMLLGLDGHAVRVLADPTRALEAAVEFAPDIVFLDLGMPGLDGYQLAELLRKEERLRSVRLVAVSGWGTSADRARTRLSGIDAHLTKPASPEDLRAALGPLDDRKAGSLL